MRSIVMVFDVAATLGGVAFINLRGGSISTLRDVGRGGGKTSWQLAGHNRGELANHGKMLELGAGRCWDRSSKLFE